MGTCLVERILDGDDGEVLGHLHVVVAELRRGKLLVASGVLVLRQHHSTINNKIEILVWEESIAWQIQQIYISIYYNQLTPPQIIPQLRVRFTVGDDGVSNILTVSTL